MNHIHARVKPETIKITEKYYYEKHISSNDSLEEKETPQGEIEIAIPYDGEKYFNQLAIKDVEGQINNYSFQKEIKALIGHLAISNHEKTNLESFLGENQFIQLFVPVSNNTLVNQQKLSEDRYTCILKHNYKPNVPKFKPILTDLQILDDDDLLSIASAQEDKELWNHLKELNENDQQSVSQKADSITEQVKSGFGDYKDSLKRKLFIKIHIKLVLPAEIELSQLPIVKRVSFEWPTLTSFKSFNFEVIDNQDDERQKLLEDTSIYSTDIVYNPHSQSLECISKTSNIEFKKSTDNSPYAKWHSYEIKMLLKILQPGELYRQTQLKGKIEVEIPEFVLSELKARYYGFNNSKGNEYSKFGEDTKREIQLSTRLLNSFVLNINEAFIKRVRSTAKELIFENVLQTEEKLRIIRNVLKSQGFSNEVITLNNNTKWLIYAERSEGIDKMILWITVRGTEDTTSVITSYEKIKKQQEEKTGYLKMYLLGKLPRNHYILIKRMNELESELRKQL
ncbi:MAG: hypothetical protein KME64_12290 [Scytonematopsis contorta HA4267-MV1]|jgi:ribosomal protein S8|nr:hypothetical protein [Scytonematopsis contorta HA4267-MV1]